MPLYRGRSFTDTRLAGITKIQSIRRLELIDTSVTDLGMEALRNAANLSMVQISGSVIGDRSVAVISCLPKLRYLDLGWAPHVTNDAIAYLLASTHLRELYLEGLCLTDACIGSLRQLFTRGIPGLMCSSTAITDVGIAQLADAKLHGVVADCTSITGRGFEAWPQSDVEAGISLRACPIDDAGVILICQRFPKLRKLNLADTRITDESVNHIAILPRLEILRLDRTLITDDGLSRLIGHKKLQAIGLSGCNVSEERVRHLVQMQKRYAGYFRLEAAPPIVDSWSPEGGHHFMM